MATVTLPVTEFRQKLLSLLDEVACSHDTVVVTKNGRPQAVFLSHREYEGLLETIEILSHPGELEAITKARREAAQGKVVGFEQVFGKK